MSAPQYRFMLKVSESAEMDRQEERKAEADQLAVALALSQRDAEQDALDEATELSLESAGDMAALDVDQATEPPPPPAM